jgi:aryl-alcohol dehydrogenase-like predicted oxidoreductase
MELRPLGTTGLHVSALGLGTVKLGRNTGVKYPGGAFPLPTDEQAATLLRTAADLGITLLDTAPAYGTSEERLGAIMAANNWFGGRGRWVVSTKAGEEFDNATGESHFDFSPAHIRASVERSLTRLRIDTLDIVLLHSDGNDQWLLAQSGAPEALHDLKARGLIRAVGASTKTVEGGLLAMRGPHACDVVMIPYSPADRDQAIVIDAAALRGVGVLIKKGLASGHVSNLLAKMPPEIRAATADPIEAAMRFSLGRKGVSSLVVGTANPEHLRANVTAATNALKSSHGL